MEAGSGTLWGGGSFTVTLTVVEASTAWLGSNANTCCNEVPESWSVSPAGLSVNQTMSMPQLLPFVTMRSDMQDEVPEGTGLAKSEESGTAAVTITLINKKVMSPPLLLVNTNVAEDESPSVRVTLLGPDRQIEPAAHVSADACKAPRVSIRNEAAKQNIASRTRRLRALNCVIFPSSGETIA